MATQKIEPQKFVNFRKKAGILPNFKFSIFMKMDYAQKHNYDGRKHMSY